MPIVIDSVNMLEDVILLDIDNVVPSWNTYCFALDIHSPGCKRIVLCFRDAQILKLKNGKDEEDNSPVSEDKEEQLVVETLEDESEEELVVKKEEEEDKCPQAIPLSASPCNLLSRRLENPNPDPDNPTAPWCYLLHPIGPSHLSAKAEKRDADEQELQQRFTKWRKV
ncbi:hypothetical protein DFJ58DRAFT_733461 [Suillus subalutaceus]|uniref:uncharacterized protein n=1 Tax=Suillus subalutaceus TaxID=48586 RepID=UPI001B876168|nr:uncharacterized protein DFJ58DRAFT_733461 [Suillus subalutaceus]KAG1839239.1 hypothetical protein DFJ58DRAFT_733461 [Suillus subalutaceus]